MMILALNVRQVRSTFVPILVLCIGNPAWFSTQGIANLDAVQWLA